MAQLFKPRFLDQDDQGSGIYKPLFNFRRLWKLSIAAMLAVALLPLLTLAVVDYVTSTESVESEFHLETARLVSNARRTLASYLDERKYILNFLVFDNSYEQLFEPRRLRMLLDHLKSGLGEWMELGVIDHKGIQRNYAGPYPVKGRDYSQQEWYKNLGYTDQDNDLDVISMRSNISDVFLGFRNTPHFVISVLHNNDQGEHYILRASLDLDRLNSILSGLEVSGKGDAFLINHQGIIQTPTRRFGRVLSTFPLQVPEPSDHTEVIASQDHLGNPVIIGYAYITDRKSVV